MRSKTLNYCPLGKSGQILKSIWTRVNDIYGYWSPDISEGSSNATYYLTNTAEITDDSKELYFDLDKSSLVTIDIDGDLSGKLRLAQIIGESFIPFVGGEIAGNRIYTMPGTYKVSAELESDYKGESWILNISKPDPVTIGEEDILLNLVPI